VDEVKFMWRSRIKNQRGQALVEMALVLPLLLALVFGIIEFGNIYSHKLEMNNLARQSARTAVVSELASYTVADGNLKTATVTIDRSGGNVTATVNYSVTLLTGYIINKESVNLTSVVTMRDE